jgi:3-oxoacyl-[acyl-carrier protein] reductase
MASIAGTTGRGGSIAYCASKAGVISFTKSLALALAPEIRVNAIAPGFIDTPWTASFKEDFRQFHIEATPMKRMGKPADIAEVALALAVSAGFLTGQTIVVDGGKSL